ncbi:MAG: GlsB/YeaQ/YmgE family stress response membrane protein [Opitutaceae bacterium]|nr:GlsB/YeaQ/YmgE family stress response membrane protein [Opitutaceae bacterium]
MLVGGIAGWFAGLILKGEGFGIIGNFVGGVLGAVLGGWLFDALGISFGGETVGPIITAAVGANVLLFLIGIIKKS